MLAGVLCGWGMSDFAAAACANSAASAQASVVGLVQNLESGESAAGWVPPWLATVDVGLAAGSVPLVGVVCAVLRLLNGFSCKSCQTSALPKNSSSKAFISKRSTQRVGVFLVSAERTVLSLTASRFCFAHWHPHKTNRQKDV